MNKNTFIKGLKETLKEGNISDSEIKDTIYYYESYFEEKELNGYSTKDILEELGDPRLIAKTIIDTRGPNYNSSSSDTNYNTEQYSSRNDDRYDRGEYDRFGNIYFKKLSLKDKIKIGLFILGIIFLLIITLIFVFKIFVFLLPAILILIIILFIARLFWWYNDFIEGAKISEKLFMCVDNLKEIVNEFIIE